MVLQPLEGRALTLPHAPDARRSPAPLDRQPVSEPQHQLQPLKPHAAHQRSPREEHTLPQSER